jgi:transcriptional regulator with XRE-family HTH domain
MVMDNMISLKLTSPHEIIQDLASRAKQRRLDANLTQEKLAQRAQVSLGTLKLFERTGKASLEFVLLIAFALNAEKEFISLFPPSAPKSIDDILAKPKRQRGPRK